MYTGDARRGPLYQRFIAEAAARYPFPETVQQLLAHVATAPPDSAEQRRCAARLAADPAFKYTVSQRKAWAATKTWATDAILTGKAAWLGGDRIRHITKPGEAARDA